MNTVQSKTPAEEYELEMVKKLEQQRKVEAKRTMLGAAIFVFLIIVAILSYVNANYLCNGGLSGDLTSFYTSYFSLNIAKALTDLTGFLIVAIGSFCIWYSLHLFGFFKLIGSDSNRNANSKYPNIEATLRYRNGLVSAMPYDKGAELLMETSGLDAISTGQIKGPNVESTTRYINGLMGAKSYPDSLKLFTGKKE